MSNELATQWWILVAAAALNLFSGIYTAVRGRDIRKRDDVEAEVARLRTEMVLVKGLLRLVLSKLGLAGAMDG